MLEQEVKLRFASLEAARLALTTAGGRLVRSRRLQSDRFFDTADLTLASTAQALRLRREPDLATLTYKGPPQPGPVKTREEIETTVASADALEAVFDRLGYAERWRFEKHREDYLLDGVKVFIDETPVGVFVEIEGTPDVIATVTAALGKTEADYILDSYRTLAMKRSSDKALIPALVLSAGLGTRLGPITKTLAKPAVPIGDRTIGERVLAWLGREGVTDVVMNLHHLPHTITRVIGDGAHLGMTVRYSWEPVLLGSAGGPRHALPLINSDPFLIVNGDTLTDVALAPIVDAHRRTAADVTMVVIRNPAPDRYNGVVADAHGVVTGFIPKGHTTASWHFVGIQVVNKRVFAALPDNVPIETVSGVYREMIGDLPRVRIFPVDASFHDVGTPDDYAATCRAFGVEPARPA